MENITRRVRRDYTRSSLVKVSGFRRVRNGKIQEVKETVRGLEVLLICKECKKGFTVQGNRTNRKFCSRKCYVDDWKKRIPGHNKGQKGLQIAWNKNLTVETDERVRKNIERMTETSRRQFSTGERKAPDRKYEDTDIEILLGDEMNRRGLIHKKNYPINLKGCNVARVTFPDKYIKEYKLCVYADGNYWHMNPLEYEPLDFNKKVGLTAQQIWDYDNSITENLKEQNYIVLRFSGSEIMDNVSKCVDVIEQLMR